MSSNSKFRKIKLSFRGLDRKFLSKYLQILIIGSCGLIILVSAPSLAISKISLSQLHQGQVFYHNGQFVDAVKMWQVAFSNFELQHNKQNQALTLSYLALAYQQLGLPEAESADSQASKLVRNLKDELSYAQLLNDRGQLLFNQGKVELALETWKQAQNYYDQAGDRTGEIGTQLNQARALQTLGFYLRAKNLLEQVKISLDNQPDSQLKFAGLLNLGNVLRVIGDYTNAEIIIERSLLMAQKLHLQPEIQIALFNLGNLANSQQELQSALNFYRQVEVENSPVKLQAQIHEFEILIQFNNDVEAENLLPKIQAQLSNLPPSQTTIYAQIELATNLVKMIEDFSDKEALDKYSDLPKSSLKKATVTPFLATLSKGGATLYQIPTSSKSQYLIEAAKLLATAKQQAQILGNPRAESTALGRLGGLYEQTRQWQEAKILTKQALNLAQTIVASDIAYQWQRQMGRILKAIGDRQAAINDYIEAVETLRSLRQDLIAINQDVQFSFRESVEPVYRELVDLLLQDEPDTTPTQRQNNLIAARGTIESLQIAELANYFHQACWYNQTVPIEKMDASSALIYPIILRDRIEVILSIPGQPLRHYATNLPQTQVEITIRQMRQSLRSTSFETERLPIAQKIYTWLLQPAIDDLQARNIQTLVFILDGSLRNIPMAALHDGKQYLIEKYQIAIAPHLQLLKPQRNRHHQIKVLIGGLSQGTQEYDGLPGVEQEIRNISTKFPTTVLLNQKFTPANLQAKSKKSSFSIIHLATHAQFSSKPQNTYILTWKGRLNIDELNALITDGASPIELLVLSACQTAKGDERAALGIAGAAIRSGARSILASLWTVSDESTPIFMNNFYQELLKPGVTKSEAIRQAQLSLLRNPDFSHPYYWALFILVGNWLQVSE